MGKLLRVLIIEDSPDDAEFVIRELKHGEWEIHAERVDSAPALEAALRDPWDAVISDYVMPGFSGLEALEILKGKGLDLPFIMVSGKLGEDTAVEAMRAGAHDYLLKDNLSRLVPAIKREMDDARVRQEHRRAETELRDKLDFIQVLIDTLPTPIFYNDPQGRYIGCNKAFEELIGLKRDEIIHRSVYDILPRDLAALYNRGEAALLTEQGTQVVEGSIDCARGGRREVIFYTAVFRNSDDGVGGIVGALLDITERKQSELKLRHLSTHDMLTGIYNRAYFDEELERLRRGRIFPVSIVMADVDRLKEVNDHLGHAEGDALLKRAAQVLRGAFRKEDVVARVGGDEFAALLPNIDEELLQEAMDRLNASLEANNVAHGLRKLSLSIGSATAHDGQELMEAWREADERMYRVKKGRGRSEFEKAPAA
ncbi:diguanylate cyclase [Geomesophilobacter sediminis]|uniref:Diguanylate cyclase n=1 Tax=Geomesophilobacter sediminis TaxID=2798584 RepID=A0A8J7M100_9BACT|nr:diguanylate cyclase [Geomesophilobacter sediminis]MBJ6726650.1 diguanylate cyclase [Geomesophilobacter sediminis]